MARLKHYSRVGHIVCAIGNLCVFGDTHYLHIHHMRAVEDPHEPNFHELESIFMSQFTLSEVQYVA